MNLYGRHFLTLRDFTASEIEYLLDLSAKLKEMKKKRIAHRYLEGYQIALLFEKTSTRRAARLRLRRMIWEWTVPI